MPALAQRACTKNKLVTIFLNQKMHEELVPGVHIHISFLPLIYIFNAFILLFTFGRDARVEVTGKVEIRDHCLMT